MERLRKTYIERWIHNVRNKDTDNLAAMMSEGSETSQAQEAQFWAEAGWPALTASYLYREPTLPVSQKGLILAEAYTKVAERKESPATSSGLEELAVSYRSDAEQSRKVAQGLTRATIFQRLTELKNIRGRLKRAAKRVQKS